MYKTCTVSGAEDCHLVLHTFDTQQICDMHMYLRLLSY